MAIKLKDESEVKTAQVEKTEKAAVRKSPPSIDSEGVKCDVVDTGSIAYRQLEHYAKQPKVLTRIMRGAGEKPGSFETVIVNGLRINILKGVQVKLPEDVAKIIDDAFYRTDKAINDTQVANPFTGMFKPLRTDQQSENDKQSY